MIYKHIILDLEGTLFTSEKFKERTAQLAIECVSDFFDITLESSDILINSKKKELQLLNGYKPALSFSLLQLGISLNNWASYQSKAEFTDIINFNQGLNSFIKELSSKYNLILYTNMCSELSFKILQHLQIRKYFDPIITPQYLGTVKPNLEVVNHLINNKIIDITTTISVGDRYEIDITPFVKLGGKGFLVNQEKSLYSLKYFLNEK
ncbi:HAD family hydrolase [Ferruginibacter sp.]